MRYSSQGSLTPSAAGSSAAAGAAASSLGAAGTVLDVRKMAESLYSAPRTVLYTRNKDAKNINKTGVANMRCASVSKVRTSCSCWAGGGGV